MKETKNEIAKTQPDDLAFHHLKLHEKSMIPDYEILKVETGWIYTRKKQGQDATTVFVPEHRDSAKVTGEYVMKVIHKIERHIGKITLSNDDMEYISQSIRAIKDQIK